MKKSIFVFVLFTILMICITNLVFAQYTADLTDPTDAENGAATASSYWDVHYPYKAYDNDPQYPAAGEEWPYGLWGSDYGIPQWLEYDFGNGNAKTIAQYRIMTSPDYKPDDWTFEGSNNDSDWDELHSVTNAGPADHEWLTYQIDNTTAYRYYRIYITEVTSDSPANNCVDIAEMEMMEGESATITFTNGANAGLNFQQVNATPPQDNWLLGQFSLAGDDTGATLNSVIVTLGGTYDSGDLQSTPFQLYANSINSYSGSSPLGSSVADPGSGNDVTFSSFSDAIPSGTRYYWVTADISSAATSDDNINGTIDVAGDLSITDGTIGGSSVYGKLNAGNDATLPVTLSSFTAQFIESIPILCWTTQSETSNAGWNIYRGETNEALSNEEAYLLNLSLGLIPGAGSTSEPTEYSFEDVFPIYAGNTYFYWLESVDYSGESEIYGPISLTIPENEWQNPNSPEIPKPYGLHQNYPNPFNPNTEISFMMKESCIGEMSIYNIKGQKIKILFTNESIPRDELIISIWNGKDESGKEVSTGVYYYKLRTTKGNFVRKMILLK